MVPLAIRVDSDIPLHVRSANPRARFNHCHNGNMLGPYRKGKLATRHKVLDEIIWY